MSITGPPPFFENHGLLDLYNRPKWFSIDGGSQNYIKHIARLIDTIKLSTKVVSVDRRGSKIKITDSKGKIEFFDKTKYNFRLLIAKFVNKIYLQPLSVNKNNKNQLLLICEVMEGD